ncbi:zinc-binding dehydrogenase [Streptomyces johnsoniae]|uniref:Zinc-binding dehydrogenase n=1 Tax=Streptomyces johnsoniae TaxID=3075532 RepID=A0ABU2RYJ2_9ACTN|nr:zinc-binding dehydrogenase [Streptomyces sp. DSM 41886]MDT0441833.1 zinc-binding dehydrogenase [Streptomyces sp. DSM 41886]
MQAVMLREFGPPDVLRAEEVPDPEPGPGQVLVRADVVGVTFVETQTRAGRGPVAAHRPTLPVIPGNGVGGTVTALGAGADPALLGRRVVTTTGGSGGYAELVAVDAAEPIPVPEGLGTAEATALLADGRTALLLTRVAAPAAGEWVLVEAAGGGVGSLLVQLAAAAGAHVIAAAGGEAKLRLATRLGARAAVDYTRQDWQDRVRDATGGAGLDVVFDGVGGAVGTAAAGLLRPGGRLSTYGLAAGAPSAVDEAEAARRGLTLLGFGPPPAPADLRALARDALAEAAAGRLRPTIGQTFPLAAAAEAHAAIEARTALGKTLLVPAAAVAEP